MSAGAIGTVGMGATIGGGILSAIGAEQGGQRQQQMYNYQAQVAKINSQIDLQNRDYAVNQGEIQTAKYGMQEAQTMGHIITNQAASGVDVRSGSAAAVQGSQRTIAGIDTGQIRANAAKVAYDYTVRSTMDINQSTLDVISGENAKLAGDIGAASSILGTVGSVSSKWLSGKSAGLYGAGAIS
jgi:hypothetical protein